jgi:hypothetical protein
MNPHQLNEESKNGLVRQAIERLLIDSSLRDNLTDDQAKRLLDWGANQIEISFSNTMDISLEEAGQIMVQQTEYVRTISYKINELIGLLRRYGDQAKNEIELVRQQLDKTGQETSDSIWTQEIQYYLEAWQGLDADATFDRLLDEITQWRETSQ